MGQLFPSCLIFGVSTSGGGPGLLHPPGGVLLSSVTSSTWLSVWFKCSLGALAEDFGGFLRLLGAGEFVLLLWRDPCGWLGLDVTSAAFFARCPLGLWELSLCAPWNDNRGYLHTVFLENSLQVSTILVTDWHFLLLRFKRGPLVDEMSNWGSTWKIENIKADLDFSSCSYLTNLNYLNSLKKCFTQEVRAEVLWVCEKNSLGLIAALTSGTFWSLAPLRGRSRNCRGGFSVFATLRGINLNQSWASV